MDEQIITNELLKRYLQGKCTVAEQQLIADFLDDPNNLILLHQIMAEQTNSLWDSSADVPQHDRGQITVWQRRLHERMEEEQLIPSDKTKPNLRKRGIIPIRQRIQWYAAAILLFVGLGALLWLWIPQGAKPSEQLVHQKNRITPGSDRAILKLADGSTISLSDAAKGSIADQGGVKVQKTAEGEIVYAAIDKRASTQSYNSINTPNGGQYRVTLPDGSRAWLNAASSLTYPVEFGKKERRVKMTGEVYFEIAKITNENKERVPFFVETDKQVIQVLGTTFNVNAYADEPYDCTTLLEGSIRLVAAHSGKSELLKPGQQALVGNNMLLSEADIQQNLAWINGYFIFRREDLGGILRKIARWYDVTVECPPELSTMKFTGKVSRSQSLSAVTEMIASINKVKLEIKERRIIVKK
ncbi:MULTISPECIES: FecR family protein [Sphingobacterium]|uniref:FecR family protein n=1 Tax=Sphingobacterium TaxID=28453 RepID=UPI00257E1CE7|nr:MULTISPECIES: FecR domain-containing protein [Sphingobacterium]